ncbi:MAG: uridine phosphorylase [Conexivisphaerales archaeon]
MKKLKSATHPEDTERRQYHVSLSPGEVSRYVLLPGDPARVARIASKWQEKRKVAEHREFVTYTGRYNQAEISCTSTGIGAPAAAIVMEELLSIGADTFIRVGTTGALKKEIKIGDLIITSASCRFDGTSSQYIWPNYPAAASYEVVLALVEAAEKLGARYHVGLTASSDSFYVGQGRPGFKHYQPSWSRTLLEDAKRANILNFEMESSVLLTLAGLYGVRAGCVCAVIANRETDEFVQDAGVEEAIRVANEAVAILSRWDEEKKRRNKQNFYPSILG